MGEEEEGIDSFAPLSGNRNGGSFVGKFNSITPPTQFIRRNHPIAENSSRRSLIFALSLLLLTPSELVDRGGGHKEHPLYSEEEEEEFLAASV